MDPPAPNPPPGPSPVIAALLRQLSSMLAIARGLAVSGRPIDLAGLDDATGHLCAKLLDLPPEQGVAYRPALLALARGVAQLTGALQAAPVPSGKRPHHDSHAP